MQTQLDYVKLTDILVSDTNEMFRDPSEMTEESLQELISSVKEKGVIQPVMLRKMPKEFQVPYRLVCGERRYRSAHYAGLDTIPANIREMTDDEAFELQLTENLQRKDVHPLREARAYQFLMEKDKSLTIAELARRFAKTEHYIAIRLKLNDLVPDAKKDFQSGQMTLGHALVLARLSAPDQKETIEECTENRGRKDKAKYYETVHEFEEYVNDNIVCNLSAAAFKKDDPDLLPAAGACTVCPHRSGNSPMLFPDVKEKDRCFNKSCFEKKRMKHIALQMVDIIENKPDILFVAGYSYKGLQLDPEIKKVIDEHKVKILPESDYNSWNDGGAKAKAFKVAGSDVGKIEVIYLTKVKASKGADKKNPDKIDVKVAIAGIQQRTKRAAELDQEKVYVRVIEELNKSEALKTVNEIKGEDLLMLRYMIYEHAGYSAKDKIRKRFGIPEPQYGVKNSDKIIAILNTLSDADVVLMMRIVMMDKFAGPATNIHTCEGKIIYQAAKAYGIRVTDFEKEQAEIRAKREGRAKDRIAALKDEAKPKASKEKSGYTKRGKDALDAKAKYDAEEERLLNQLTEKTGVDYKQKFKKPVEV